MPPVNPEPAASAQPDRAFAPAGTGWRAHYTLAVLTLVSSFNYLDRNLFSIVLEAIKAEMHLSDTALGMIGGLAFALFYSIMGIPVAWLADRSNRRTIIGIGLTFWSLMTALTGLVQSVWQLGLTRFLMGAGEACSIAPSTSLLSDLYGRNRRPLAMSIFSCGAGLGTLAGYMMGGWVNQHYGWRPAFIVAGIPGLAVALLLFLTVKEPSRGAAEPGAGLNVTGLWETLWYLVRTPSYVFLVCGGCLMAVHLYAGIIWSPAFLMRVHELSPSRVGIYLGLIRGPLGMLGVLAGGAVATYLGRRDERWRLWTPALVCVLAAPAEVLFLFGSSLQASILGLAAASFLTAMHLGPVYAAVLGAVRVRMRAMATAVFLLFANLVGQVLGPLGVGYLNDLLNGRYGSLAIRHSMLLEASAALAAGILFWLAARWSVDDARRALE